MKVALWKFDGLGAESLRFVGTDRSRLPNLASSGLGFRPARYHTFTLSMVLVNLCCWKRKAVKGSALGFRALAVAENQHCRRS